MIHQVGFLNSRGQRLNVSLHRPNESGLVVKSITGLGPVNSSVSTSDIATGNGAYITNARTGTRNIVVSFAYLPNPTIEATRLLTYKFFVPNEEITVLVQTEHRSVYAVGCVETNEPDIFSDLSGCQISIICKYPYFYDINEKLIEETAGNSTAFDYVGDIASGFHCEITMPQSSTSNMQIAILTEDENSLVLPQGTDAVMTLDTSIGSGISSGTVLCIDTMWGSKQIYSGSTNLIYMHESGWPTIEYPSNILKVSIDGSVVKPAYKLKFNTQYIGV